MLGQSLHKGGLSSRPFDGTRIPNKDAVLRERRTTTGNLTQEQIGEIREKYVPRIYTIKMLATEYNVGVDVIKRAVRSVGVSITRK
jgi:hypothetical protein